MPVRRQPPQSPAAPPAGSGPAPAPARDRVPAHVWRPGELAEVARAQEARPGAHAALEVRGLRKTYGPRTVLAGADLDVRAGELVAVLGANGSGKSTCLRCVAGLVTADAGSIRVAGREITGLRGAALTRARREAAMVFQQIHLVRRRSALDNVCCGGLARLRTGRSLSPLLFPRDLREEGMACLHRVGLSDRAAD